MMMQTDAVRPYYRVLSNKTGSLLIKRLADILCAAVLMVLLFPLMLAIALWIALDSPGGVLYTQKRVTAYHRHFSIYKFRTMVAKADQTGPAVTGNQDARITRAGQFLRKLRLDEIPQLINILLGDMSFVGTRPEAPRYVARYTDEMNATLLLPAGLTSRASLYFRDEAELLAKGTDVDETYVRVVLPQKMALNLSALREFSLRNDLAVLLQTFWVMLGKGGAKANKPSGAGGEHD